jgi:hypothetical protein
MRRGFIFGVIFTVFAAMSMGAMNLYTYTTQQAVNRLAVSWPQAGQCYLDDALADHDTVYTLLGQSTDYTIYAEAAAAPCTITVYYTIADTANSFVLMSDGDTYTFDHGPPCDSVDIDRGAATAYAIFTYKY